MFFVIKYYKCIPPQCMFMDMKNGMDVVK